MISSVTHVVATRGWFAVQTLNWNSHHIDDYIMEVMALVRDVNETLATIKGNVKRTAEVLAGWVANPMFDRKEGKVCIVFRLLPSVCVTALQDIYMCVTLHSDADWGSALISRTCLYSGVGKSDSCQKQTRCLMQVHTYEELTNSFRDVSSKCHSLISDGGKEITKLLSSSNRTLKVSKGAPAWKAYVDYIGDIVIDGLVECIIASVHRLTSQVGYTAGFLQLP